MERFSIENREKPNLEMYKGRRLHWSFYKMYIYIYAHPLAGLNLTLTMHINAGFLSFPVIDTIEK